ncbi:MAG: hypothetical protein AAFN17_11430 [Pseudomonadota bacterium]
MAAPGALVFGIVIVGMIVGVLIAGIVIGVVVAGIAGTDAVRALEGRLVEEPRFITYVDGHDACDRADLERLGMTPPDTPADRLIHTTGDGVWYCGGGSCTLQITFTAPDAPDVPFAELSAGACTLRTTAGLARRDHTSFVGHIETDRPTLRSLGVSIPVGRNTFAVFDQASARGDVFYTTRDGKGDAAVLGIGVLYDAPLSDDTLTLRGVEVPVTYGPPTRQTE